MGYHSANKVYVQDIYLIGKFKQKGKITEGHSYDGKYVNYYIKGQEMVGNYVLYEKERNANKNI